MRQRDEQLPAGTPLCVLSECWTMMQNIRYQTFDVHDGHFVRKIGYHKLATSIWPLSPCRSRRTRRLSAARPRQLRSSSILPAPCRAHARAENRVVFVFFKSVNLWRGPKARYTLIKTVIEEFLIMNFVERWGHIPPSSVQVEPLRRHPSSARPLRTPCKFDRRAGSG